MNALMLEDGDYMGLEISYAAPGLTSGHMALEVAHKFWNLSETSAGSYAHMVIDTVVFVLLDTF